MKNEYTRKTILMPECRKNVKHMLIKVQYGFKKCAPDLSDLKSANSKF